MKRTPAQNKKLWQFFAQLGMDKDDSIRASLALQYSNGRTDKTEELEVWECRSLISRLAEQAGERNVFIERLQWGLRMSFANTKYENFSYMSPKGKRPHFAEIDTYCLKQWKKRVTEMTEKELERYIAIVKKWK